MGRHTLRLITVLGLICIMGIAVVQIYWFRKAFDLKEKQFTHRTTIALNRVAEQLLESTMDSTARLESIRQLATNYFTVEFNTGIDPEHLEEALYNEFHNQEIDLNFEYGIYECFSDSFIYGNYVDLENYRSVNRVRFKPSSDDNFYFAISFPQKESFIASQLRIWLVFSALLLAVIFFFGYALIVIFKQKRLSEIKTDFINNMTHELKTPLSTISASSEVLMRQQNPDPARVSTYATIINQESQRLKQQIESVLKISVLDSGRLTLARQDVDLSELLDKVVRTFRPLIEVRGGRFQVQPAGKPLPLKGDANHLENVFHNLLENAVKYAADTIDITLVAGERDGRAVITVSDKGIGIPKDMQGKIFDKFFRVPTGNVHDTKGFGIGLYYVRKIVQGHRGTIGLDSQPGQGTTFTISLPLSRHNGQSHP